MENRHKGRLGELVQLFENRRKNDMEAGEYCIKMSFPFVDEMLLPILRANLPEPARLLSAEEAATATGSGIMEEWFEEQEVDGSTVGETVIAGLCAFNRGKAINENGDVMSLTDKRFYNRRYGYRVWSGEPTDEQILIAPWETEEAPTGI